MATNVNDILRNEGLDAGNEATKVDPWAKHMEAAGIEDVVDGNESKEGEGTDASTKSGEGAADKTSDQQKVDTKASDGTGKNIDPKSGVDAEGKKKEGSDQPTNGDLKLADGTVVKAGPERRFYDQLGVARQQIAVKDNQVKQLTENRDHWRSRYQQLEETSRTVNGADPVVTKIGIQIVGDLQRDPVGTVKKLVAECLAAGHTIDGIQAGLNAEVLAIVNKNLNARTDVQQGPTEQELLAEADTEVKQFFTQFPDARVHDDLIGRVIADHPQLSLADAYFGLKDQFAKKGLDWSKPLPAQTVSGDQPQQQAPQKQMPNGRTVPNANAADNVAVVHESTSTDDLVKMAMREAGLNI